MTTLPSAPVVLTEDECQAIYDAIVVVQDGAPRSCGKCGQPDAQCDGDCLSAAYASRITETLAKLLRRVQLPSTIISSKISREK